METTALEKKGGAYRWIVLAILVLSFTSTFLSRFIWAPAIPTAAPVLGMNMAQAGNLMSAFYFGYLFTQIPGGFLADKFRVKYWLFGCVALVAILTFAMASVSNYATSYAIRFIGGLCGGGIMAFCARLISNYFAPKERGIAFGILLASPSLGSLIANQVGPQIINSIGGEEAWRVAFQVAAYIIAAIAVLVLLVIREPKPDPNAPAKPKTGFVEGLKNYFTNKQIMILSIAGFFFMSIPAGYVTWANKFIAGGPPGGLSLTVLQAGLAVTIYSAFSIIGSMSSGFIGKKFQINPKTFIMVIYVLMVVTLIAFGLQKSFTGILVTSALFGLVSCMSSTHITYWAVNIGGNKYAATTTSIQNLIFQSANVIFPILAGSLIDRQTDTAGAVATYMPVWYMYGILLAIAFVIICFASKKSAVDAMKG